MVKNSMFKKTIKKVPFLFPIALFSYRLLLYIRNYPNFIKDFKLFRSKNNSERFSVKWRNRYPCLSDKTKTTSFDSHYTYHSAWAARIVAKINPDFHIDISSTLRFCSIVSAFIPVRFYDYRPAQLHLSNLESKKVNLLSLPFKDESIYSLSCMHTIEHIGLGRYGDLIDPNGDLKAISELKRVLAKNGNLLFVVPVGKPKILFNAHRIYSYEQIIEYFSGLELKEFSLIPDNCKKVGMIKNASSDLVKKQNYACGLFWFKK